MKKILSFIFSLAFSANLFAEIHPVIQTVLPNGYIISCLQENEKSIPGKLMNSGQFIPLTTQIKSAIEILKIKIKTKEISKAIANSKHSSYLDLYRTANKTCLHVKLQKSTRVQADLEPKTDLSSLGQGNALISIYPIDGKITSAKFTINGKNFTKEIRSIRRVTNPKSNSAVLRFYLKRPGSNYPKGTLELSFINKNYRYLIQFESAHSAIKKVPALFGRTK